MNPILKAVGNFQSVLFQLPLVGEPLVRGLNRGTAYAALYAPVLGGKRGWLPVEVREN